MRQLLIPTRFTQEFKTMVRTGTEESLSVFRVSAVLLRNSNTGCHYQTKKKLTNNLPFYFNSELFQTYISKSQFNNILPRTTRSPK